MALPPFVPDLNEFSVQSILLVGLVVVALALIFGPRVWSWIQSRRSSPPTAEDLEGDVDELSEDLETTDEEDVDVQDDLEPLEGSPLDGAPEFTSRDEGDTAPEGGPAAPRYDDPMERVSDHHQYATASNDIENQFRNIRTDDTHRQVFFAEPDDISDFIAPGALQEVFGNPELQYDLSIHVRPLDRQQTRSNAKQRLEALRSVATSVFSDADDEFEREETTEEMGRLKAYANAISNGQRPADITMVVGSRGADEDELEEQAKRMKDTMWRKPADIGLETAVGMQEQAIQSLSPIGKDPLGTRDRYTTEVLGLGLGGLLGSINRSTVIEEGGIEWGEHAGNRSPILKDPFKSEKNYNQVWIGDSGAGKSYNAKLNMLRTWEAKPDTLLIMLDPVEGFRGLAKAIGAKTITIGGSRGLNVMEIRRPPEDVEGTDRDPFAAKMDELLGIIETYANLEDVDFRESRFTFEIAAREAYKRRGIDPENPSTFGNPSPTINDDLFEVLEEMQKEPGKFAVFSDGADADTVQDHAEHLATILRPFKEGGRLENLGQHSDFDIRDSDAVYLDMSQQDAVGGKSLMMQILFSLVYERAKETPKNVILAIDEAEKLMQSAGNMQWFADRVRRARHIDMSTRFITQDVQDFFKHDDAEVLINNSTFRIFHNTSEIERWRETLDLSDSQARFVKDANTGEGGYSNALYQFNDRYIPARIEALEGEDAVVDYDVQEDEITDLPGHDAARTPFAAELERRLREGEHEAYREIDEGGEPAPGPWEGVDVELTEDQEAVLDLLNPEEMQAVLAKIEEEDLDPDEAVREAVVAKAEQISDLLNLEEIDPVSRVERILENDPKAVAGGEQ